MNQYRISIFIILLFVGVSCSKSPGVQSTGNTTGTSNQSLLDLLKNNYDFSQFYQALQKVHLDTMFEGPGPYTILMPDNVALQAQGITGDSLANMDTVQLRKLLLYHIIKGSVTYASVPQSIDFKYTNLDSLPLYFSEPIPGNAQQQPLGPGYYNLDINGIPVATFDVLANNGVIQVMQSMLSYPAPSIAQWLENNPDYSLFTEALRKFNLLSQLDTGKGPFTVMAPTNESFENDYFTIDTVDDDLPPAYPSYLWGCYIMPNMLFFRLDMADGPQEGYLSGQDWYIGPQYVINFDATKNFTNVEILPLNYQQQYLMGNYEYSWGDYGSFTDPDHPAFNGVVHGISGILIYPDTAAAHP